METAWWRADGWPTAEEWSALASVLTLAVAAVAAVIALRQLQQGARQLALSARADERSADAAESEARPYITVRFDFEMMPAGNPREANGEGLLFVLIESVGRTPARNISLSVTPDFASSTRGRPADGTDPSLEALRRIFSGGPTISMLSTGQQLRYLLDFTSEAVGSETLPQRYDVHATYSDATLRNTYAEEHVLDMGPWAMTIARPKPIDTIARQLRRMNQRNEEA
ncbi:hypothetical protein P2P98_14010 [Microbacterium sp. Kw_RZR3]|uniref:hypothetical protein n=1 Tax=Microbacterium sp. Kw_RZR3 TaxID=3032903 RepID=UPI0023DA7374|nr:hypothetical protein [Microbacterium sp. Kw_RZR3]MDF2047277.1 hypothetical protein [Microbacterium sp. Kw_RZR3]